MQLKKKKFKENQQCTSVPISLYSCQSFCFLTFLCTVGRNIKWKKAVVFFLRTLFLKKPQNKITIWSSNFTSEYMPQRFEIRVLKRYLYTHVHSSSNHNRLKIINTDIWMLVARGSDRKRRKSYCFMGIKFHFYKMKRVKGMDAGDGCRIIWMYLLALNCALKMVKMVNFMCILALIKTKIS